MQDNSSSAPNQPPIVQVATCQSCKFLWKEQGQNFCRRGPPQSTQVMIGVEQKLNKPVINPYSSFPLVLLAWWCGEYKSKMLSN